MSSSETAERYQIHFNGFDSIKGGKGLWTFGQRIIYYRWFRKACVFMSGELLNIFFSIFVNFQAILMSQGVSESRKAAQKDFSRGKLDFGGIWIWH